MTMSDLAVFILGFAVAVFFASFMVRRGGLNVKIWQATHKLLAIITMCLAAYYFYQRFMG